MPANRKVYVHNMVYSLTFRTREGLPFGAKDFIMLIMNSIFARAQSKYPFPICQFTLMGNHFHSIPVCNAPENIPNFVEYVKRESAHALNSLLGNKHIALWEDGYECVPLLCPAEVIERLVYHYANPAKANLVDKIEDYPNLNSWQAFKSGGSTAHFPRIPRTAIPTLPGRTLSLPEEHELYLNLLEQGEGSYELKIEPNAWMECFDETRGTDPKIVNDEIERLVRLEEDKYRRERKFPVLGAAQLKYESIRKSHKPKKYGPRMLCYSTNPILRRAYISWYREFVKSAPKMVRGCLSTDWLRDLPPGLFAPGGSTRGSLLKSAVPYCDSVLSED